MKKAIISAFLLFFAGVMNAQELFPVSEPASTVPKGALGVKVLDQGYKEAKLYKNLTAIRLLYGVSPKLSLYITGAVSNYHEKTLPFDFITHGHSAGQVTAGANKPQEGVSYPYIFNGVDLFAKYRFLSNDGENTHFRMAAYGELSYVAVPAHEAEPDLLVHTSGFGAGVIATYLKQHFAVSATTGFILPREYKGNATDKFGGIYPTTMRYGNAINYDLSFGYLLFPQHYTSYKQLNWNIYLELIGKTYGAAKLQQRDGPDPNAPYIPVADNISILQAGNYIDINPGLQCIIRSIYRIDASIGLPLVNRSYNHLYPLYMLGMQRYFYFTKPGSRKSDKLDP